MFKNIFITGIVSGIVAAVACFVYAKLYSNILVDFSEAVGVVKLLSNCMLVSMIGCFVFFGISKAIKKNGIAEFIFNFLFTISTIAAVFVFLKENDPEFKNEDAQMMIDYYKGFIMPMLFFPALSWMTFKPLFVK